MRLMLIMLITLGLSFSTVAEKILIIGSYHQDYSWESDYNRGIKDSLGDKHTYYDFHMDTKRLLPKEYKAKADQAWALYQSTSPDLVFLGDDNAVKYLHERFRKTDTPVVFLGVNSGPRQYKLKEATNFTGVFERPLLKRSIILVQQLMGKKQHRKVLVLFDSGITSLASATYLSAKKHHMRIGKTDVDIKTVASFDNWQQQVLSSQQLGYDAIFIGLYQTIYNSKGKHIPGAEVLAWTRKYSPVPHFGFWSFSIGLQGNIGGYVLDGYIHGVNAASIGRRLLTGAKPSEIFPKIDSRGRYILSKSGIKKWQLQIPDNVLTRAIWVD